MKLFVMNMRKSIREQYLKLLDREPTLDDLDFYADEIQKNKINLEQLFIILKNSNEYAELQKKEINFQSSTSFSTPKRLVFFIDGIPEKIERKKKIIKGPKADAPQAALEGFIKSHSLNKKDLYKKNLEKGEFYFAEFPAPRKTQLKPPGVLLL